MSKFNPLNISYLNQVVIEKGIGQTHKIILQDLINTYITYITCPLFFYYLESLADWDNQEINNSLHITNSSILPEIHQLFIYIQISCQQYRLTKTELCENIYSIKIIIFISDEPFKHLFFCVTVIKILCTAE